MKKSGIVRRVDDLGRIVIPKEMRKTLRINEGDSLEIYVNSDNDVVLSRHSHIDEINRLVKQICDAVYQTTKNQIIITDKEKIIGFSKGNYKVTSVELSGEFIDALYKFTDEKIHGLKRLEINNDLILEETKDIFVKTLDLYGDRLGLIIMVVQNLDEQGSKLLINTIEELILSNF